MSSQAPDSEDPESGPATEAEPILSEAKEAAEERVATTKSEPAEAKPAWWRFWAKR